MGSGYIGTKQNQNKKTAQNAVFIYLLNYYLKLFS